MKTTKHIPKFKSETDEAKFWATHDVTDFSHDLKEVRNIKFTKPRKRLVSLRMEDGTIESLKEIAATKGLGYLTLLRLWVNERLSRESRLLHSHR